jgi:NAD+ synthase
MDCKFVKEQSVVWLQNKLKEAKADGFVVGVSGGVDSALVSTLCAEAGKTIVVSMPLKQQKEQVDRAHKHITWLESQFRSVTCEVHCLDYVYAATIGLFNCALSSLALANMKSRLRMVTLYAIANNSNRLVAGTGNKVEDYGVGFFTKYGDGGVDISPIGDLMKTEVRQLAAYLGVSQEIVNAVPTDGLWDDNRSDESQLGASYADLEEAMEFCQERNINSVPELQKYVEECGPVSGMDVLIKYLERHEASRHKLEMPPVCKVLREYPF